MSRWLDAAKAHQVVPVSLPDTPTKGDKSLNLDAAPTFCRVLSGCRVEELEKDYGDKLRDPPRHSVSGRALTWTDKVVSLDDWRQLGPFEPVFTRLAVTSAQIEAMGLLSGPPKKTDRRSFDGTSTVQCEAIPPNSRR